MIFCRDVSSKEPKTNSMKKHIDKSQGVNFIVMELNRKNIIRHK